MASKAAAAAAVTLTGVGTFLPHYVWNFSPDVFSTLLLASALLALPPREAFPPAVVAGLLFGLACISKFPYVVFLPGLVLLAAPRWRILAGIAAGMLLPMAALAALDAHLFGSPFVTSYDRIARIQDGRPRPYSQRNDFTLPMIEGAAGQILDPSHGLLRTSPVTLVSVLGLLPLFRRDRRLAVYFGCSFLALFLLFSTYRLWSESHYGNRFLMPLVGLGPPMLAALLDAVSRWRRRDTRL